MKSITAQAGDSLPFDASDDAQHNQALSRLTAATSIMEHLERASAEQIRLRSMAPRPRHPSEQAKSLINRMLLRASLKDALDLLEEDKETSLF